jgi:hypothetical protein
MGPPKNTARFAKDEQFAPGVENDGSRQRTLGEIRV